MKKRTLIQAAAAAAASLAFASPALAQDFPPAKPVTLVVGFAATSLATVYHYAFGWVAPYDLPSLPKILGAVGGASLMLGTAGLWRLNLRRHPLQGDAAQKPMNLGFIALLFLVAASGLALWLVRITPAATPALALLLCLHLGAVMALFATMPYGKFAHGIFRTAALLRHNTEKRRPNPIGLGSD